MSLQSLLEAPTAPSYEEPAQTSDYWQDLLQARAAAYPLFRRRPILLMARKGLVVLTGTVTSFYEKQLAQEYVRHFDGVEQIDNHLEVEYAVDETR